MPINSFFRSTFALCLLILSGALSADDSARADQRISLGFSDAEKAAFLSEMRQMLVSVQGVIAGIGAEDRSAIVQAARYSGNRMARDTPLSIKQKTPLAFKEIGAPTHMMFEELVVRAETDDMSELASLTGELMKQCVACHALFTVQ
ncbi:MAG: hypothetical protein H6981_05200 [Gammaproteobacteria bacterium]|nr:hypothetical protein [Gammaproteobacteria bacterium]MCP5136178.1 hypothetical protein [Gammaproteobacteria bacterium]